MLKKNTLFTLARNTIKSLFINKGFKKGIKKRERETWINLGRMDEQMLLETLEKLFQMAS